MANRKPALVRLSICLTLLCIVTTGTHAVLAQARDASAFVQKPFALELEGSAFSVQARGELKALVANYLREQHKEDIALNDLQGSFGIHAVCPAGFVTAATFSFSTRAITITKNEGANCNGPQQCRTWVIEGLPDDLEARYDFALKLQCSNHDALRSRSRQPNTLTLRALVEGGQ